MSIRLAAILLFSLLTVACSSSQVGTTRKNPGFELINATGSTLRAVYISPTGSDAWQENVLGNDQLNDGSAVQIIFSSEEQRTRWDVKIEGTDGHFAEWKDLDLHNAARITLSLKLISEPTVVADVALRKTS